MERQMLDVALGLSCPEIRMVAGANIAFIKAVKAPSKWREHMAQNQTLNDIFDGRP